MNKITRCISLVLMAFLFIGNAWSQGFIIGPAAKRLLSTFPVEVGNPSADSPSRQKLQDIANNPDNYTFEELEAATQDFYNEANIVMPEDGKTYLLVHTAPNGTQFYADEKADNGVATDIALTPKAEVTDPSKQASIQFTCKRTADGKYNFVTASGNYFCIHSSYNGSSWMDVSRTGFTTEYKAEDNDLELQKLVPGEKVSATPDKLMGLMCIKGKRGIRISGGEVGELIIGYLVIKSNGSDYDGANDPYFTDINTSAIRLIEVAKAEPEPQPEPSKTFPIAGVTPEGGFDQTFEAFPEITLTFDNAIQLAAGKEIAVAMRGADTEATAKVTFNEAEPTKAVVNVEGANVSGLYTLTIPQGLFVTTEGAENEEKVLSYIIEIPVVANTFNYESVNPQNESEVKVLDMVELTYNSQDQPGYIDATKAMIPIMCGEEFYATATIDLDPENWNCVTITLVQDITEPGTYTLQIPEGVIWNTLYDEYAEDKGVSAGARYNPEFTLTYTVNPVGENVQNIDELSIEKAYLLYNPIDKVYAVYDTSKGNNIWSANPVNGHFSDYATTLNIDSPSSSWMGIKDKEGNFYIYNLGNEKFLQTPGWASNGNACTAATFSTEPVALTVVTREDGYLAFTSHADDDHTFFCAAAAEPDRQMSIWTSDDHGCAWVFQENPNVKADSEILDKITAIQQVISESNKVKAVYDLSGVKMQVTDLNKLPKGVYIVNGKKVVK